MKKFRYLGTDIFVEEKGGRTIRLLQSSNNNKHALSNFACDEGKVHSIINCSYFTSGYVCGRNQGDVRNDTHDQEGFFDLVFLRDGTYKIGQFKSWDYCNASQVLGGFSVATILMQNGANCEKYSTAICGGSKIYSKNPQTAIAVLKNGDVLQIVSDGRTSANTGITGYQLRDFIKSKYDVELLCQLDGGGSTEMIVEGKIVNSLSDGYERPMYNGLAFLDGFGYEKVEVELDNFGYVEEDVCIYESNVQESKENVQKDKYKEGEQMKIKVIDVSSYQPNIDYKAVKESGVQGVILRCGRTYWGQVVVDGDDCFEKHYQGFKAVGMPVGVYYYSCANTINKAKEEGQFVLDVLKGKQLEMPVYFDVENKERQQPLSKQALTDITKAFCEMIESNGYYVGIYASASWLKDELDMNQLKDYDVWVAHYGVDKPSYDGNYGMWQYSSSGTIKGISGNVDVNWCYKDYPSIIKKAHLNGFREEKAPISTINPLEQENARIKAENEQLKKDIANVKQKYSSLIAKIKEIVVSYE